MKQWRWRAALSIFLLGAALVTSSAFAQARRYPAVPTNPGHPVPGVQARALRTPQAPDLTQADYSFLTIDPEGVPHCWLDVHALNDARMAVVEWTDDCVNMILHSWLWNGGRWTSLDWVDKNCPDTGTQFESLNDRGIAFGTYWSASCNYEPASGVNVRTGQSFALPNPLGFQFSQGTSMSENGLAVGWAWNSMSEPAEHWMWDGVQYHFPTYPPDWDVTPWGGPLLINNAGQIAGFYIDKATGVAHGFFQDGANTTIIDAPGASGGTFVNGLTKDGTVLLIGGYDQGSPDYPARSFTWKHGVFKPLPNVPFPDSTWTTVTGINMRGDLSGLWIDGNGGWNAFIALRK
jgi:hypothetical protein